MENDSRLSVVTSAKGIGLQASDYKTGDVIKLIVQGYGGICVYFPSMVLNPNDRLIEVEIKSVKKVKEQEYIEA